MRSLHEKPFPAEAPVPPVPAPSGSSPASPSMCAVPAGDAFAPTGPGVEGLPQEDTASYHAVLQPLTAALCRGAIGRCVVRVLSEDGEVLIPVAGSEVLDSRAEPFGRWVGPPLVGRRGSVWDRVLRSRTPVFLDTACLLPGTFTAQDELDWVEAFVARYGHGRFLVMPLTVGREPLGVVVFGAIDDDVLDQRTLEHMAQLIAQTVRGVQLERAVDDAVALYGAAHQRLEETAELLRIGWELSDDGLALIAPDGTLIQANSCLERMAGCQRHGLVGRRIGDIIEGDLVALAGADDQALHGAPGRGGTDNAIVRAGGHRVPVLLTAQLITDGRGRPRVFFVKIADLSERMLADRIAKGRRTVLDALARDAPSATVLDLLAHHLEDLLPDAVVSVHLLIQRGAHLQTAAAPSMPEAGVRALDAVVVGPDGEPCSAAAFLGRPTMNIGVQQASAFHCCWGQAGPLDRKAVWALPVFDAGEDRVVAVLAVHRDTPSPPSAREMKACEDAVRIVGFCVSQEQEHAMITGQAQALRSLSSQQTSLMDTVRDGIIGLDRSGCFTSLNASAEEMLGWTEAELLGRSLHQTLHHAMADRSPRPLARSMINRSLHEDAVSHVRGDVFWSRSDRPILVDYTCIPLTDGEGRAGLAVVLFPSSTTTEPPVMPLLTERERAVLQGLARGLRGEQAALEMHISNSTLQTHLKNAISKLGASGRTQAVILAAARGEIDITQLAAAPHKTGC